jgi:hypothetical protein
VSGVFISYRRVDTSDAAERVSDDMKRRFGRRQVFFDVDDIDPGARWRDVIDERLSSVAAFVPIIGPNWAGARDHEGRLRLFEEHDHVRREIAAALRLGIPIVPVLVDGATMPRKDELPPDIHGLLEFNALVAGDRTGDDVDRLARALTDDLTVRTVAARTGGAALYGWTVLNGVIGFVALLFIQTCSISLGPEPAETIPARPFGLAVVVVAAFVALWIVVRTRRALRARRDARRVAITVLLYLIGPTFAIFGAWLGYVLDPNPP